MAEKKANGSGRTRNWSCIVYPESAPKNWRDIIDSEHIEWVESPLHDADLNADNSEKKPHWHILLSYESVKTFEQVHELTRLINAPIPQKVSSPKGLVRYMIHLDNPEKKQYSKNLIIGHGVNIDDYFKASVSEEIQIIKEMQTFCRDNKITELFRLADYALENRADDWYPTLINKTIFLSYYLKSFRHSTAEKNTAGDLSKLAKKAVE